MGKIGERASRNHQLDCKRVPVYPNIPPCIYVYNFFSLISIIGGYFEVPQNPVRSKPDVLRQYGVLATAAELGLSEAHLGRYKGIWTQRGHQYVLLKSVLVLDASAVEHQELRAAPAHDRLIETTKALRVF